jgi:F0F1-type ATP synthase alpha subunit
MNINKDSFKDIGVIISIADDIVVIKILSNVSYGEMVVFCNTGLKGLVLNLRENEVGVIILGNDMNIYPGDYVYRTKSLLNIPVGDKYIGRVIDPLGNYIDNVGKLVKLYMLNFLDGRFLIKLRVYNGTTTCFLKKFYVLF